MTFVDHALPLLYSLFVWWFGTVAILHLDGRPRELHRRIFAASTVLLLAGGAGLHLARDITTAGGAYLAFSSAVLLWAWQELAFLLGYITGPRRLACPPAARGTQRLRMAIGVVLYHEIALVLIGGAVWWLSQGAANQVGWWTWLVLWVMRLSAKLNVYLGVRNLGEEFLPAHLRYIGSYFRRRPMNALFPFCIAAATVAAVAVWRGALTAPAGAFEAVGLSLAGTLLALAVIEHWFLVIPLPTTGLWSLGMRSRST